MFCWVDTSPICDNIVANPNVCSFFHERHLKVLKCYHFLWVQRRQNCSPAASFANCDMTLYLLKVQLQTFLSILVTQKRPNFGLCHSCSKWGIRRHYKASGGTLLDLGHSTPSIRNCTTRIGLRVTFVQRVWLLNVLKYSTYYLMKFLIGVTSRFSTRTSVTKLLITWPINS